MRNRASNGECTFRRRASRTSSSSSSRPKWMVARVTDSSALKHVQRLEHGDDDELDENDDGLDDRCDKTQRSRLKQPRESMPWRKSILSAITTTRLLSKVWSLASAWKLKEKDKNLKHILPKEEKGVGRNSKERVLYRTVTP